MKLSKPKFKKTIAYLMRLNRFDARRVLEEHGRLGVALLSAATPVDTGEAASSWDYKIEGNRKRYKLIWTNSKLAGSVPLVLLLQYGHATKAGYFIPGRDFINPALKPVYISLSKAIGQEIRP